VPALAGGGSNICQSQRDFDIRMGRPQPCGQARLARSQRGDGRIANNMYREQKPGKKDDQDPRDPRRAAAGAVQAPAPCAAPVSPGWSSDRAIMRISFRLSLP
jgi:hypothetical protein